MSCSAMVFGFVVYLVLLNVVCFLILAVCLSIVSLCSGCYGCCAFCPIYNACSLRQILVWYSVGSGVNNMCRLFCQD